MYKHIPLLPNSMITMNTLKLFLMRMPDARFFTLRSSSHTW